MQRHNVIAGAWRSGGVLVHTGYAPHSGPGDGPQAVRVNVGFHIRK
ncbi:hypothetical protein [Noviherbaspirillum sp. ST9]